MNQNNTCVPGRTHTFTAQLTRNQVGAQVSYRCPAPTLFEDVVNERRAEKKILPTKVTRVLGLSGAPGTDDDNSNATCWFCGIDPCKRGIVHRNLRELDLLN